MSDDTISAEQLEAILKALANPARLEILQWLKDPVGNFPEQTTPYEQGVCVGQIYARSGLSQSTVSSHLASLQRAGLLSSSRLGQWVYYRRDEATIAAFTRALQQSI